MAKNEEKTAENKGNFKQNKGFSNSIDADAPRGK
jgi:hypothetical protein